MLENVVEKVHLKLVTANESLLDLDEHRFSDDPLMDLLNEFQFVEDVLIEKPSLKTDSDLNEDKLFFELKEQNKKMQEHLTRLRFYLSEIVDHSHLS